METDVVEDGGAGRWTDVRTGGRREEGCMVDTFSSSHLGKNIPGSMPKVKLMLSAEFFLSPIARRTVSRIPLIL